MATSKARATLADLTKDANELRKAAGEKPVKKFASKDKAQQDIKRLRAALRPAAYSDTIGQYTGAKVDFNIDPLPAKDRIEPREGSLRHRALAKMQTKGITMEGAIKLCRDFDKERGKKTNVDTVARRAYELIRLVAVANGYGAKQKEDVIKVA